MGISIDNPRVDGKTGSASKDDADTRNFIETHHVTKVAPKAVPGAGEESADLVQDEKVGGSAKGT